VAALVLGAGLAGAGPAGRADKARARLDEHLGRLKARGGQVVRVETPAVARALPEVTFFAVRFRQFPVARVLPAGLSASNVFVVSKRGDVQRLAGVPALQKFFQNHGAAVTKAQQAKDAVVAWLTLSEEFHQDGFFKFEILRKEVEVKEAGRGLAAGGRAMVVAGGNGALRVTLHFGPGGRLKEAREEAKIKPGPRPICQATKLLDPDPVVRRMAEQDLLIMGRAAGDYLREQRARATPELRRAIDRLWQRIVDEGR
jgi:hypothetical protein